MITTTVKVTFSDNNSLVTRINTDLQGAKEYYLHKWFNLGSVEDHMVQAIMVEQV